MKCHEVVKCSKEAREACFVWNSFRDNPQDMDNVKCWVLKGAYQDESGQQLKKCRQCAYYLSMNRDTGIMSASDAEIAMVTCDGMINLERTKALEKVWETLKQHNRFKVILDLTRVKNIYSSGLGAIVKMQKDITAAKGLLVVVAGDGHIADLFISSRISRILRIVKTSMEARDIFEQIKKKETEAEQKAEAAARAAAEKAALAAAEAAKPKERPACYVYFKNHNPKNATTCDECSKKIKPTGQPCWIVDGMIEGISFQYVEEECEECPYFMEFGGAQEL
ncbi:MAG TPA: STAS domain-containing protein [Chitinivibrionales bacterium]|nr:STAS domain-containing protein [Chitinivibrionales bacterium]